MADGERFPWPGGARAAISFTFDDARPSQVDVGLRLFDARGHKATWYVSPPALPLRADQWRQAAAAGHEIGNHTLTHPCTGNFPWSRANALEDFTLARMEAELAGADAQILQTTGATPRTFAYPCGQTFVGRGETLQSYIPVVARRFLAGRAFMSENANDPAFCDFANLGASWCDGRSADWFEATAERAREDGAWLILAGHDIGPETAYQTTRTDALNRFFDWLARPDAGFWVGTVAAVAAHIKGRRPG